MAKIYTLALAICTAAVLVAAYHGPDLPPGPFCGLGGTRGGCCQNRNDNCSHYILETLCYCDSFCKQVGNGVKDDCCPDFEVVCLHETPPDEIQQPICILGKTKMDKCNKCTCTMVNDRPDWSCETSTCLMSEDVVRGVGSRETLEHSPYGWRAATYPDFEGKQLKDGLVYKLGTLPLTKETLRMNPIRYNQPYDSYPSKFDARERWRGYISEIMDQGWCGSDWALTVASITSDRLAISTKGRKIVAMSPQALLSCNDIRKSRSGLANNCDGGHIDVAWNQVSKNGLVDAKSLRYEARVRTCPVRMLSRQKHYHVSVPFKLDRESDIMYELMNNGPVHAIMEVQQDFFHYKDGVYRRTPYGDQIRNGLHSIRLIGWGEENRKKYWIAANTWGPQWGENGYFRIQRGANESMIETFVVGVFSDGSE